MSATLGFDHVVLGLSRILQQHQESPKFVAFIRGLLEGANQIEQTLEDMESLASVDLMAGVNLDVIGIIVGAGRLIDGVVTSTWFGFEDTGTYATVFGEEGIPNIGARFYEEGESLSSTSLLQDPEYRLVLKAKIVKNNSSCTPEDILAGLRFIFNTLDVRLIDNSFEAPGGTTPTPSFSIGIGRPVYAYEQAVISVLDILPRPAGIAISGALSSYTMLPADYVGGVPPYDPLGEEQ